MKNQISPAVAVVLIVVVLVIIIGVGWFAFMRSDGGSGDDIDIEALDQQMRADPAMQGQGNDANVPTPAGG